MSTKKKPSKPWRVVVFGVYPDDRSDTTYRGEESAYEAVRAEAIRVASNESSARRITVLHWECNRWRLFEEFKINGLYLLGENALAATTPRECADTIAKESAR